MKGANEFYDLISSASRYKLGGLTKVTNEIHKKFGGVCSDAYKKDNIVFLLDSHARGKTFKIWLYDGEDLLKVYDVVSGQPGWTEVYGWTKKGSWVKYILKFFRELEKEIELHKEKVKEENRTKRKVKNQHIEDKVNKYNSMFAC